jgi:glycerophosphoryl diester phosphodiesterase
MGAGIIECDVTFTKDAQLVCRHAQCDLHTTTDILETPLAAKCAEPFTPAQFHPATGARIRAADARCCASDLTLAEFKSLKGKMDASDPDATTVRQYLGGTAAFRTDLYATGATLMSHAESIALIDALGAGFTPELKAARQGFGDSGLDQQRYARKMIQEYVDAGIAPQRVWPQSFSRDDVLQWVAEFQRFASQAVLLDGRKPASLASSPPSVEEFAALKSVGISIVAPPMPVLLALGEGGGIVPSRYARNARQAGLDLITWTAERSGRLVEDVKARGGDYYFQGIHEALRGDGDVFTVLDVLARDVGVRGVFSDWPATTTYYAGCMGIP